MARRARNYLEFEWDNGNVDKNWIKHKVAIKESEQAFVDPNVIISEDPKHSIAEKRWLLLGKSELGRKLAIIFTRRGNKIRVISARSQSRKERGLYEQKEKVKEDS
jgi:uncharacterized DUF497 family protein